MTGKSKKEVFMEGAISPEKIAAAIASHASLTTIGAHSIFLGQIRADEVNGKRVIAIEYSAYREMADDLLFNLREDVFSKYDLTCMHIFHSLGRVKAGEISLFVFTSSIHRAIAIEACSLLVEEIKSKIPIWGKEIFEDEQYQWKKNTDLTI